MLLETQKDKEGKPLENSHLNLLIEIRNFLEQIEINTRK